MLNHLLRAKTKLLCTICVIVLIATALWLPVALSVSAQGVSNITLIDTKTNSEVKLSGEVGTAIPYPADPVDPENQSWFMGWYTNDKYTTEYVSEVFESGDITLYARWASSFPSFTQDFENYTWDSYSVATDNSTGRKTKSNRLYFFDGAEKQSSVTYNNSGYAVKIAWDSTTTLDYENPSSYDAAGRWKSIDRKFVLGKGIENKTAYKATVKYYVEKADTSFAFNFSSAAQDNIWTGQKSYGSVKGENKEGWNEASFEFVTDFSSGYNYMYILLEISENKDVVVYIDDISFVPVSQPYEAFVNLVTGYEEEIVLKGNRGDDVVLPELTHPEGAEFLGYYTDSAFTTEFTSATFSRKNLTVYAKWGPVPYSFRNYPFEIRDRAVYSLFIRNEQNVGYNDDYALNFLFDGDASYQRPQDSAPTYFYKRVTAIDSSVKIATVNSGSVYRVTYLRKSAEDCESDYSISFMTANYGNYWTPGSVLYKDTKITAKASEKDWVQETLIIIPNFENATCNSLFISFNSLDATENSYVNAYVDNILVEELTGDMIYFDSNVTGVASDVVTGKAGDAFTAPVLTNGRCEFLGWFTDKEYTTPFTADTIPEGFTTVYAKWSVAPEAFEKLPYALTPNDRAYYTISAKEGNGIGFDDNYALNFFFDGDKSYQRPNATEPTIYYTRATGIDNSVTIGTVESGLLYKVSYYRRAGKNCKSDFSITISSGVGTNIWAPGWKSYSETKVTVKASEKDWVYEEIFVSPTFTVANASSLMLMFHSLDLTADSYVDGYVDNVMIEKIYAPYIFYNFTDANKTIFVKGEEGDEIVHPTDVTAFGKKFNGWYIDEACTTKFTETHYAKDTAITLFAGWTKSDKVTYTFESYDIPHRGENPAFNIRREAHQKSSSNALSGNKVIEFNRGSINGEYAPTGYAAIAHGTDVFTIDPGSQYIVTVNYYIAKKASNSATLALTLGMPNNYWGLYKTASRYKIDTTKPTGKWYSQQFVVDSAMLDEAYNDYSAGLFLELSAGDDGIFHFDNVTISKVPAGQSVLLISNEGCSDVPTLLFGTPGKSYSSKLPEAPTMENKLFKGYYTLAEDGSFLELPREEMAFGKNAQTIYARFIDLKVTQNFDGDDYMSAYKKYNVLTIMDFDYELYDSEKAGNSKDNVTSGKYSLHRLGKSNHPENATILTPTFPISESERYTLTFKVKLGAHSHTDGAIKIASCINYQYAWDTRGDYYPVIAIADLADGQWHEVTYTFNSVEYYVAVQTPGNVELFMDDFVFTLSNDAELSVPVNYTEHIIGVYSLSDVVDITSIIYTPYEEEQQLQLMPIILIAAGGVVFIGILAVITVIIIKRKKRRKV